MNVNYLKTSNNKLLQYQLQLLGAAPKESVFDKTALLFDC